jgi:D-alanyl-D-alanine carboxypeptidase
MIENEEKKQPQIHLKTDIDVFGKKTVTIKNGKVRSKKYVFIATILAILVGISVPYFLVDAGSRIYEKAAVKYFGASVATAEMKPVALGSDDNNFDIPEGQEILINDGPDMEEGQYYFQSPDYVIPRTSGDAYIVADVDTGEIIIEKNPEKIHPIASISKIVTAIVAKERMNQHDTVTVSRSSINIYGTAGGLRLGEKILVTDLYYPLLMESSNDAADVFAEGYGYDKFIGHMNTKAKEIGMHSTSFFEPSGLSEKNVSTAGDLFKLAQYVTKKYPEIWDISRVRQYAILGHSWSNGSVLARRADFIGGKNGFTYEANQTTIVVLNVKMEGGPRRIAITLLQSGSRENDVSLLQRFVSKWVGFLPVGQSLNEN